MNKNNLTELSASEVGDITGHMPACGGFMDAVGIGNGRYFIPSVTPHASGSWGFREVSRRRFCVWVFLRSKAFAHILPGDIALALSQRRVSAIIQEARP